MEENKKNIKLFEEFPPVSTEQWETKINKDLKDADYEEKLIWKTNEGFNVKPYYRAEDLQNLNYLNSLPGEFPFIRGNKKDNNNWEIRQDIIINNSRDDACLVSANKEALNALSRGAASIGFIIENTPVKKQEEFSRLVKGISLEKVSINFALSSDRATLSDDRVVPGKHAQELLSMLYNEVSSQKLDKKKIKGSINYDPLGYLTLTGNLQSSDDYAKVEALIEFAKKNLPNVKVIAVNGQYFHNSGSSIVQELAFSLTVGNEYLAQLIDKNLSVDDIAPYIQFIFAVGSNYFMEIAKLRAARILWAQIITAYKPADKSDSTAQMYIHSVTSRWNKTIYDPYVNMLRTTTESMSSVIGSTDSLTVLPFDTSYKTPHEFSERIAQNTQIILKEESHLNKIVDPSAGSYYIECLTDSIAEQAWKLFKTVENKGGYFKAFKQGFIQDEIAKTAQQRDRNIASGKEVFVGTNKYPDLNEKIEEAHPPTPSHLSRTAGLEMEGEEAHTPTNIIAQPLKLYRGAEAFERLRLKKNKK